MNKIRRLLLLSSSCLAVLISVSNAYGQNDNQTKLYNECENVAGKSLCDFLFKRDTDNTNNLTDIVQSNYTDSTNSRYLTNSSYLTYNDNNNGFSIQHPSDWLLRYQNTEYGTVIGFAPEGEEREAYVDVRVNPKGDFKSIKEYGDMFFKESDQINLLAYYRNSTTELGGKPAFKAVYLVTLTATFAQNLQGMKSEPAKGLYIGTMVPEKKSIYSVVYLADPLVFDKYLPQVEKMVDSFKIHGKGPIIQEDNSSSSVP